MLQYGNFGARCVQLTVVVITPGSLPAIYDRYSCSALLVVAFVEKNAKATVFLMLKIGLESVRICLCTLYVNVPSTDSEPILCGVVQYTLYNTVLKRVHIRTAQ